MDIRSFFGNISTTGTGRDRMLAAPAENPTLVELREKGYAIVKDVLSDVEVRQALEMFHTWRTSVPNLDFQHNTMDPHGIYKFHEAGHQRHAWFIRTRPKVKEVFSKLWKSKDMIVSYDGSCYLSSDVKTKDNVWTHTDQGSPSGGEEDHLECFQGFVALTNNKQRTFTCYRKSHKLHAAYFKEKGVKTSKNWNLIDTEYLGKIREQKVVLEVPAGSMVLWDSRTFHQNQYGPPDCGEERIVQYVCMLPRSHKKNTPSNQNKRRKYFDERRTTSHWPCRVKVNGKQGQTYGDAKKVIDYEKLPKIDLDDMIDDIMKLV
jgi:hypothetical protein